MLGLSKKSKVISYGIMSEQGSFYTEQSIVYGTNVIAGVEPKTTKKEYLGLKIYNSIKEITDKTKVDACVIHGSKNMAYAGIIEAIEAEIRVIVCLVGGIPSLDMLKIREKLAGSKSVLIGPSSLGLIIPGQCKLGVIPDKIVKKGNVGMITRHGSLTFEILNQLHQENMGISACVSLGSELVKGMSLLEAFKEMQQDKNTKIIVILANISGFDEEKIAKFYRRIPLKNRKPVVIYMAGSFYSFKGKTVYRERILGETYFDTNQKKEMLFEAGMAVLESPAIIAKTTKKILNDEIYISSSAGIKV